jgi:hypothetical protein
LPVFSLISRVAGEPHTGQVCGIRYGCASAGRFRQNVDDLRNDVAGALDHHRIADADILALPDRLAGGIDTAI